MHRFLLDTDKHEILRGIKGIRKGVCPATFASGTTGTATVNATVDDQSVSAVITISAAHGGGHSTGTYYWVNTGNTEEQGYTGPEPTVMGYNPPPVTPAGTPVVAPQSRQVAGSTPVIEQQTVAAPPAASTAPSSGIPVVPAVAALAGIGVIGGGACWPGAGGSNGRTRHCSGNTIDTVPGKTGQ